MIESQSFQLLSEPSSYAELLYRVAEVAHSCYQSTSKDVSLYGTMKFIKSLWCNNHTRPFEFGTVYLVVPKDHPLFTNLYFYSLTDNPYIIVNQDPVSEDLYVSTSYLWYLQHFAWSPLDESVDLQYSDITFYTPQSPLHLPRITVKWRCSRAVADEFRTHVTLSSCMESTRYVNYKKKGLSFIKPAWADDPAKEVDFISSVESAEFNYLSMLDHGYTPQQAREILPLSVATTFYQCGFPKAWKIFCNRRNDSRADANAHILAAQLQDRLSSLINFSIRIY